MYYVLQAFVLKVLIKRPSFQNWKCVSCFLYLLEGQSCIFWPQINNAGTNIRMKTIDYTAAEYSTIMSTNLESAYHLCQLAHPVLKASGAGSIVFVSSVAGLTSLGTGSIYAASKGMLLRWHIIFSALISCKQGM